MKNHNMYYPVNRAEWRKWLTNNHKSADEIWVIYYKKHTNKPRIPYDDAVEEALCFGWIDSTVKRIDDEKYCQRFTPRNEKSEWSKLNKKRVSKLIKSGLMTEYGLIKINAAKKNGMWNKTRITDKDLIMPDEFKIALEKDKSAKDFFYNLTPSHKKRFIAWIVSAKMADTKNRRIQKSIELLSKNEKLGMV